MTDINIIPGEKLLIKIWDSLVDKGIGGLLTPGQIKREGKAHTEVRREELLILAQAEKDAQDVLAGRKVVNEAGKLVALPAPDGNALADQRSSPKLLQEAASKFAAREVKRHVNLQRIAISAEEQAHGVPDKEVADEPVDDDWLNRWRENAQDVSDEHMQKVWGRILAEEVKAPGSYGMGTLEFLRTLSKADALKIAAIGPYAIGGSWMHRDLPFLQKHRLHFGFFLELQEMGILSGVESLGLERNIESTTQGKFQNVVVCHDKALLLEREAIEPKVSATVFRVTKLGREILRLGDYSANDEYLSNLGAFFKAKGLKVTRGRWIAVDANSGRIADPIEL